MIGDLDELVLPGDERRGVGGEIFHL
jgi:hypothetical protein